MAVPADTKSATEGSSPFIYIFNSELKETIMSDKKYEKQRQKVLAAIDARLLNEEVHDPSCTHRECEIEREERKKLELMPEHRAQQASWVDFMKDLGASARAHRKEVTEFDMFGDDVVC